jgi:hypothetical protein
MHNITNHVPQLSLQQVTIRLVPNLALCCGNGEVDV